MKFEVTPRVKAPQRPTLQDQLQRNTDTFRIGVPLGRLAQPRDHANAMVFPASEEASNISGQCLYVDGLQSEI